MALALGYAAAGFLVAGFSEAFSPLVAIVLLVMWYRTRNRMILAVVAGLVLGMFVVALAPGNVIRAHLLPPRMEMTKALTRLVKAMLTFFGMEAAGHAPALLLAFLTGYLSPTTFRIQKRLLWAAILIPISLAAMSLTIFIPLYLAGGIEQRHYTFAALILVLTSFTLGVLCAGSSQLSSSS